MTQVSKYPLSKAVEQRIFEMFFQTIIDLKTSTDVTAFLEDFLTPTEKMMLAKRLAIAVLLAKGYQYREISKTLRVSLPTISDVNVWFKYRGKGYKKVINSILTREKVDEFWEKLDDAVNIIPPAHTNWSAWRSKRWQEKRVRQKPF